MTGHSRQFEIFKTDLGFIGLVWSERGLRELTFPLASEAHAFKEILKREPAAQPATKSKPTWLTALRESLRLELKGEKPENFRARVPLDLEGRPPFHSRVYQEALKIKAGEVISYVELAQRAGSPRAARAVGQAMARNPLPLVVPCHRVLASGGKIGGFTAPGGLASKKKLLAIESQNQTS